ncbi:hypothetical protein JVT61DRAFT_15509 [Boletus reticuloceps]|uniref:Uncharacterized protein n=1 Tax=Boletus reticuloceps TaxID=495285 RepID=A0A8I2YCB1_9AGAM|nr:hypothetical protein JVT61DRAFT_15509 [Boletus reticuloceps]
MHSSTHQHVYATNLRQNFGYPLRNPKPNSRLGQPYVKEGLQIGDVGYVDDYGEFIRLFNIKFPLPNKEKLPEEFHNRSLNPPDNLIEFTEPVAEQALWPGKVFKSGVNQNLKDSSGATYKFTSTSKTGAILILPDGAILSKLEDKQKLEEFRQHAMKYALQWCIYAQRDSLYLITSAYKTKTWTLGSFYDGSSGGEIHVNRQPRDDTPEYVWTCEFNVDDQQGPGNNSDVNQTVLIKGFKITARQDWFRKIERVQRPEWWFARVFTAVWPIRKSWKWLSRTKIEHFPTRNLSQPTHPLDVVNRVLFDKNPDAQVVVTHDNAWIEMLEKGLPDADLLQEDRLREFIEHEYTWHLDSEHRAVYLQRKVEGTHSQPEAVPNVEDSHILSALGDGQQVAITNMRLECLYVDPIYAGVCILVQIGSTMRKTENKSHASVIDWDDVIMLPSHLPIKVTVCGAFQLGSPLGTREICVTKTISITDLSGDNHLVRLFVGEAKSSSLLITLVRHCSHFETHSSHDENPVFVEKTKLGFRALYSHHDKPQKEYLEGALECFRCALEQCNLNSACRATALFNLATSEFIRCQADGTYSELITPIELYGETLKLRDYGDPDRTATSLLLAQALLLRYGREPECDESLVRQIEDLLAEIQPDGSREHQTADAILRTCRFYQAIHSGNPAQVDQLLRVAGNLEPHAYVSPYGFSYWPHILHKLGVTLWTRFQVSSNLSDLDQSVALNEEALRLIPEGHHDQASIVACLGPSLLRLLEVRGDLKDLDMSAGLTWLGNMVVTELDNIPSAASSSWHSLRDQIWLMSAAYTATFTLVHEPMPTPWRTPELQNLLDEWIEQDGITEKCEKLLKVLLSFLRGEGEKKMQEMLLTKVKWPFKEHKIEETMQVLHGYMPYFHRIVSSTLKWMDELGPAAEHQIQPSSSSLPVYHLRPPPSYLRNRFSEVLLNTDGVDGYPIGLTSDIEGSEASGGLSIPGVW